MNATPSDGGAMAATPDMTGTASRRERARAPFAPRTARRLGHAYSRYVGAMKVLLVVAAAVVIALVVVWPYLTPTDGRFRLGFSNLVTTEAESPNIVNPRLIGTDNENKPFSITADIAKNFRLRTDFWKESTPVELEMPKADITLDDGTWLVLTANTGLLTPSAKTLRLDGSVNLFHDSGYEFRTSSATINLKTGTADSTEPVEGQGPFGELTAQGMHLADKGKTIVFTGKARVLIYPSAEAAAK